MRSGGLNNIADSALRTLADTILSNSKTGRSSALLSPLIVLVIAAKPALLVPKWVPIRDFTLKNLVDKVFLAVRSTDSTSVAILSSAESSVRRLEPALNPPSDRP